MKVVTRVNEYLDSDKEIFIESEKGRFPLIKVDKSQNLFLQCGERIANAKVKMTEKTDALVTIVI